ncbi:MFS transporter [Actinocorallia populi]|uniref:MFS transporter n=1 Tax=Actinocorallia populi TaxID=2079200 RepID=UPI000D095599|nr:MFS transporter [Actinocorallia populi]
MPVADAHPEPSSPEDGGAVRLSPEGHDPNSTERDPVRGPLRRLLIWFFLAQLGVFLAIGAVGGILLPLQVEEFDPADKTANLALITVVGAVAGLVVPPLAGVLSDRTRSRLGRRAPWLLAGAALGAASLVVLRGAGDLAGLTGLAVTYLLLLAGLNLMLGPFAAVLPDRVPRGVRGRFSAAGGLGVLLGMLGGQAVGSAFSDAPFAGHCLLAVLVVLGAAGFVRFNPDHPNQDDPRPALPWATFLRGFWVSPRAHPDFAFGFAGRLLTFIGYYLVNGYQLYLLQDYIGLGDDAVDWVPLFAGIALVTTVISTVVGGTVSDRLGRRKPVVIVSGVLIGLSLIGPWMLPSVTGFGVYAALAGLGFGAYMSVDQALLSEVLPSAQDSGKDLGVLNIAVALPQLIAPGVAGVIATSWGYAALFPIGLAASVAGAAAVLAIRSVR